MADTTFQLLVEDWVRHQFLAPRYNQRFSERHLNLTSGGKFEFDAVSDDGSIVASISTSAAKTATGNRATGAVMKLRSDMLFLLMAKAPRPMLVLTQECMCNLIEAERKRGRVPPEIIVEHAPLSEELADELKRVRVRNSSEMYRRNDSQP
jgi:hypothetical protein